MNKSFIFSCILLLCLFNTQAQNVSIGPVIGLNYSKTNKADSDFKAGFTGGVFLNYSTKTDFGFNGSLIYSQLGNKVKNFDNYLNLNYVQLPINLVYYFGEGMREGSFRPKLFLGPYLGLLVNAKSPGFVNKDVVEQMNAIDYGVNVGAGFNYAIRNKTWINLDLKYGFGLANIPKINTFQNRALSLNLGISFPLGTYNKKTGKLKK
jgi:Outer membrane protein beta-barrel domain